MDHRPSPAATDNGVESKKETTKEQRVSRFLVLFVVVTTRFHNMKQLMLKTSRE